jgi:hypothetical protein
MMSSVMHEAGKDHANTGSATLSANRQIGALFSVALMGLLLDTIPDWGAESPGGLYRLRTLHGDRLGARSAGDDRSETGCAGRRTVADFLCAGGRCFSTADAHAQRVHQIDHVLAAGIGKVAGQVRKRPSLRRPPFVRRDASLDNAGSLRTEIALWPRGSRQTVCEVIGKFADDA